MSAPKRAPPPAPGGSASTGSLGISTSHNSSQIKNVLANGISSEKKKSLAFTASFNSRTGSKSMNKNMEINRICSLPESTSLPTLPAHSEKSDNFEKIRQSLLAHHQNDSKKAESKPSKLVEQLTNNHSSEKDDRPKKKKKPANRLRNSMISTLHTRARSLSFQSIPTSFEEPSPMTKSNEERNPPLYDVTATGIPLPSLAQIRERRQTLGTKPEPEQKQQNVPIKSSKNPREHVVAEILQTEKDYLVDVKIIIDCYLRPLRGDLECEELDFLLNKKQLRLIFSNIELLFNLNQRFLMSLIEQSELPYEEQQIGNCFLQIGQFLKLYSEYCVNQRSALDYLALINGVKLESPICTMDMTRDQANQFCRFCDVQRNLPECRNLDFESYLIKPVQRVCKYPLLLRELEKNTPETHVDYPGIQKAILIIREAVQKVNDCKRDIENFKYFTEIQQKYKVNLIKGGRHYVRDGSAFMFCKKKQRYVPGHFYLFSDLFAFFDNKNQKLHQVTLIDSLVLGKDFEEDYDTYHAFELLHPGEEKMCIGFESEFVMAQLSEEIVEQIQSMICTEDASLEFKLLRNSRRHRRPTLS